MSIDRPIGTVFNGARTDCRASSSDPMSDPEIEDFNHARAPPLLDREMAVRAAAARLNEGFGLLDPLGHPEVAALAHELAALLCAYSMVGKEVDRMGGTRWFTGGSDRSGDGPRR